MAIEYARARYVGRSGGGNAVQRAAYNERSRLEDENIGQTFNHSRRRDLVAHDILLPTGADQAFKNSHVLWNAVEASEKRRDAQVAREVILALQTARALDRQLRPPFSLAVSAAPHPSHGLGSGELREQ